MRHKTLIKDQILDDSGLLSVLRMKRTGLLVLEPRGKLRLEMGTEEASGTTWGAGSAEIAQGMVIARKRT